MNYDYPKETVGAVTNGQSRLDGTQKHSLIMLSRFAYLRNVHSYTPNINIGKQLHLVSHRTGSNNWVRQVHHGSNCHREMCTRAVLIHQKYTHKAWSKTVYAIIPTEAAAARAVAQFHAGVMAATVAVASSNCTCTWAHARSLSISELFLATNGGAAQQTARGEKRRSIDRCVPSTGYWLAADCERATNKATTTFLQLNNVNNNSPGDWFLKCRRIPQSPTNTRQNRRWICRQPARYTSKQVVSVSWCYEIFQ